MKNHNNISILKSNEFRSLIGRRGMNIVILICILVMSLGGIAFSYGLYKNLKLRMDNPYTNWVDLPVLYGMRDTIKTMIKDLSTDESRAKFNLKNIIEYNQNLKQVYTRDFLSVHDKEFYIRSISYEEDLFRQLLVKDNVFRLFSDLDGVDQGCSIYISKQMFDALGLEWTEDKLIELPLYKDDRCLLIKVVGVLYNIPNYADMICSAEFMNLITDPVSLSGFFRVGNLSEIDIISKEDISKYDFEFQNNSVESIESNEINCFGSRGYFTSRFYFKNFIAEDQIPMYLDKIKDIVGDEVALNIDWQCKAYRSTFEIPQYLAFNFTELTKVKEFKELIKKKYEVEIDISEIEDKNNFAYVTTLVVFAIVTMSIIGILSFVIFIFFLIKDHFEKIKQNLGTFLAFGISKELLLKSYLSIILKMVLYSMFVSIALLSIFQFSIFLIFKFNYLNLNNIYVIFVALIFILTSMIVSSYVIRQILKHSPGDLVYNRT